jgi:hypothetical protein
MLKKIKESLFTLIRLCGVQKDLLCMAVEDFRISQSIYQDEAQHLYR